MDRNRQQADDGDMKRKASLFRKTIGVQFRIVTLILLLAGVQVESSQSFTNLNFESATLVPVPGDPYNGVQFASAFPGWTETIVGAISTNALYNNVFIDSAGISIIDPNWPNYISGGVIQGNFTAILQSGLGFTTNGAVPSNATLSQTGLVPVGTKFLTFETYQTVGGVTPVIPFTVTLGGQTLSLITISNALNYIVYGADVSQWAGQTEQLAFTSVAENPHHDSQYLYLDAIQFSPFPVPEPSEAALITFGVLLLGFRRR